MLSSLEVWSQIVFQLHGRWHDVVVIDLPQLGSTHSTIYGIVLAPVAQVSSIVVGTLFIF